MNKENENISMNDIMNDFELKHFRKGEVVKGKVISIKNDEVIVNIGHFADGIIPKNEVSNQKDFNIEDIFKVDEEIFVMVLSGDDGEGNVLLSKKRADAEKVWDEVISAFKNETLISVTLREVVKGGLVGDFNGIRIFIPASQCAAKRIENLETMVDKTLEVKIIELDKSKNKVVVSRRVIEEAEIEAKRKEVWADLSLDKKIEINLKEVVKGGVVGDYKGVRIFMPASQAAGRKLDNLEVLIGKNLEVQIIELDDNKKKIVVSRRIIEEAEREAKKTQLWSNLKVGEKKMGKVTKLVYFGAFVEVAGVEGLVHLSDLSWKRVVKPEDVVSVGDEVEVYIQEVDMEKERLSLAIKDVKTNPWEAASGKFKAGDVVSGTVTKFMKFGAFVEIEDGVEGLVHLSEITDENVAKASDVLKLGQQVKVKVLDVNEADHKISLSIKDATEKSKEYMKYNDTEEGVTLGDLFKDFKF